MKLCILVAYMFLIKKINFRVSQCISGHVIYITKHGIYMIGHVLAIFKDRHFWFGPKNSIKLGTEHFTIFEVIKCISGHVTGD